MLIPFRCSECGSRDWRDVRPPVAVADVYCRPCKACGAPFGVDPDVEAWDFPEAAYDMLAALDDPVGRWCRNRP